MGKANEGEQARGSMRGCGGEREGGARVRGSQTAGKGRELKTVQVQGASVGEGKMKESRGEMKERGGIGGAGPGEAIKQDKSRKQGDHKS